MLNDEFKAVCFALMNSHQRMTSDKYRRNTKYNDQHFSHKAEDGVLQYITTHELNLFKEYIEWKEINN